MQAASFRLTVEKATVTPLTTLSILIQQNPQFASLVEAFPAIGNQLLASVSAAGSQAYRVHCSGSECWKFCWSGFGL